MQALMSDTASRALSAIITGASTGIGADLARVFARNGHPLVIVARNRQRLEALADELLRDFGCHALVAVLDLEKAGAAGQLAEIVRQGGVEPGILVNNAGFGLLGEVRDQDAARLLAMIDLNMRALTDLTLTFLPGIIARRGAIMNVASTASWFPGPGMAVYYASKAYVRSFTTALAFELAPQGVRVSALCPGPTQSEFFDRAGAARNGFAGMVLMPSMKVAQAGYAGLMAGKRVIVPGFANKLVTSFAPFAPDGVLMRVIGKIQISRAAKS